MPEIGYETPDQEKTAKGTAALLREDKTAPSEADKGRPEEPNPIDIPTPVMWWFPLTKSMRLFP